MSDPSRWCRDGDHDPIWLRDQKQLIVPSFIEERAGKRMVTVQCLKCHAVYMMDLDEYLRTSRWG